MEEIEAEKENSDVYVRVTWDASPSRDLRTRVGCGQNRLYSTKTTCFSNGKLEIQQTFEKNEAHAAFLSCTGCQALHKATSEADRRIRK